MSVVGDGMGLIENEKIVDEIVNYYGINIFGNE